MKNFVQRELAEYKILLRSVPGLVVTLFVVSVISMNLLANKEWFSTPYLAIDCGFSVSWISFLCMDMICKHFGPKASVKIAYLAMAINFSVCLLFWLMSLTPGMWGEFYSTGLIEVNDSLNKTIGGSWYVVLGSSCAMAVSFALNSFLNGAIGKRLKQDNFKAFALRSYISTALAQFADNLVFATLVSHVFFGWSWITVLTCSITCAFVELACEIVLSPIGYKITCKWKEEQVGREYLIRKVSD